MKGYWSYLAFAAAVWLSQADTARATLFQRDGDGAVSIAVAAPPAGAGWQSYKKFNVPVGQNLIYTYKCPSGAPVAVNGAFYANTQARAGLSLVSNFRVGSDASTWEWIIYWPSGAPAQSQISFNIYCGTN